MHLYLKAFKKITFDFLCPNFWTWSKYFKHDKKTKEYSYQKLIIFPFFSISIVMLKHNFVFGELDL